LFMVFQKSRLPCAAWPEYGASLSAQFFQARLVHSHFRHTGPAADRSGAQEALPNSALNFFGGSVSGLAFEEVPSAEVDETEAEYEARGAGDHGPLILRHAFLEESQASESNKGPNNQARKAVDELGQNRFLKLVHFRWRYRLRAF
jgi:hypothetical protein